MPISSDSLSTSDNYYSSTRLGAATSLRVSFYQSTPEKKAWDLI